MRVPKSGRLLSGPGTRALAARAASGHPWVSQAPTPTPTDMCVRTLPSFRTGIVFPPLAVHRWSQEPRPCSRLKSENAARLRVSPG